MSNSNAGNRQNLRVNMFGYQSIAKDVALSSFAGRQLMVHSAIAYNSSASTINVGIGSRFSTDAFKLYSELGLSKAQPSVASPLTLVTTTNNQGTIIQCKNQFSLVTMTVSQTQAGTPVYAYQYWNGTTWATLTTQATPAYTATAETTIVFAPPVDWVSGSDVAPSFAIGTVGFCIRVIATTAPSTAVQISALNLGRLWALRKIAASSHLEITFRARPMLLEAGEGIQPYFQAASAANTVEVSYQVQS